MNARALTPLLTLLLAAPAVASTPIDQTRPLAAGGTLQVENIAGSIRIVGSPRSDVRITGTLGEGAESLVVEGDERRLRVEVKYPDSSGWGGWWGGGRVSDSDLVLEVPEGIDLDVEAVSASIEASGLRGPRVDLESVSGDVTFDGAPQALEAGSVSGDIAVTAGGIGEVDLESVSGRIELTGEVGAKLQAESVSGSMRLSPAGALQAVQASAVSGKIELRTALASGGRLSAESLSGELAVTLPKSTSARLDASSFSGSIRSDVGEVEREEYGPGSSLNATIGGGDGQIRLESFSGTLRLKLE